MSVAVNGIAHIQLTVSNPKECVPFWERLCHFLEMRTLLRNENVGLLHRQPHRHPGARGSGGESQLPLRPGQGGTAPPVLPGAKPGRRGRDRALRARGAPGHHGPRCRRGRAVRAGYYSVLFEDPDGIRVEVNYVPGKGHFGRAGASARAAPDPPITTARTACAIRGGCEPGRPTPGSARRHGGRVDFTRDGAKATLPGERGRAPPNPSPRPS